MDAAKFKKAFISESKEAIDNLNNLLIELEKDPSNSDLVNEIFRIFHTLKGNSAAMGYEELSEVSHKLEDVFDLIRNSKIAVDKKVMDVLFKGSDIIETTIENIDENDDASIDSAELLSKISDILGTKDQVKKSFSEAKLTESELKAFKGALRVIITFQTNSFLRFAKAKIIINNLKKEGEILKINPEDITKMTDRFEIILRSSIPREKLENKIRVVSLVGDVYIHGIDEQFKDSKLYTPSKKTELRNVKTIKSVRIDIASLDKLMNLVGELLIARNRLFNIAEKHKIKDMHEVLTNIDRLTSGIQEEVMSDRMLPIGEIMKRFPRMVRDISEREKKEVNLVIEVDDLELDRTILDELGEPLVHLIRNAIDHGIEAPDVRVKNGKPAKGTIRIVARRGKEYALVDVIDDGGGIDTERLRSSLVKKNIVSQEKISKLSDEDVQKYIFQPGVTTKDEVTDISGRGVGMDVVAHKMSSLGGRIRLNTSLGKGTIISLSLPYTLAIIRVLLVKAIDEIYAIPLSNVIKTIEVNKEDIGYVQQQRVIVDEGRQISLYNLNDIIGLETVENETNFVVIVEKHDNYFALVVDEILQEQQILIKKLHSVLKGTKAISGSTILGTGNVALILDVATMI